MAKCCIPFCSKFSPLSPVQAAMVLGRIYTPLLLKGLIPDQVKCLKLHTILYIFLFPFSFNKVKITYEETKRNVKTGLQVTYTNKKAPLFIKKSRKPRKPGERIGKYGRSVHLHNQLDYDDNRNV